jgi:hypothetical protein
VGLDERKLKIARYLFDRHGGQVVLFGRFIVVLRTYAAFLASASRMRWLRCDAGHRAAWPDSAPVESPLASRSCVPSGF